MINYFLERWKRWQHHSGLKQTYFVLGGIASIFLIVLLIILSIKFIGKINDETTFRDIAIALFATLSGLGVLFGFYTSIIRTETAEQGLITDRINKATEGLGKSDEKTPVIEVRLGALYALERISQDSLRDHVQIMEILCAYIRHNSPRDDATETRGDIREDIQAALTIIGRRGDGAGGTERLAKEKKHRYRIDLRNCHLQNAELREADLSNAWLRDANLNMAILVHAKLNNTWLNRTQLSFTNFNNADMTMAYAHIGNFSNCLNLTQDQLNQMTCGLMVEIPKKLKRPKHWPTDDLSFTEFEDACNEWRDKTYPKHIKNFKK